MITIQEIPTLRNFHHPFMHWACCDESHYWETYFNIKDTAPPNATPRETQAIFNVNAELLQEAHDSQPMELDVPPGLPDGAYRFSVNAAFGHITMGYGIIVENRKIEPNLAAHAIFIALARHLGSRPDIHHTYVNNVSWDGYQFSVLVSDHERTPERPPETLTTA